jgi:hypothetical protein
MRPVRLTAVGLGEARRIVQLELDFWLLAERRNLPIALPEFNVMAVNKLFCLFGGVGVVVTFKRNHA